MLHEVVEQAEFSGAEVDFLARPADPVRDPVNDQVAPVDPVLRQARPDAAHDSAYPRRQFGHGERLYHIVVSPGVEAADAVGFFSRAVSMMIGMFRVSVR